MNKRYFIFSHRDSSQSLLALFLTSFFLALGCIIGTVSANSVSEPIGISSYLDSIFTTLSNDASADISLLSVFIDTAFYHLLIWGFGFCAFGFIFVPILVGIRGYIFAFSVATLIRCFGSPGILPAFLLFGAKALIAIPCLIFIAVSAMAASFQLTSLAVSGSGSGRQPYNQAFLIRCAICFVLLALLSVAVHFLSEPIFNFILSKVNVG